MKLTSYFIKHPVITIIVNSMIVILGLLCFKNLSVREYPDISFPVIRVLTHYPNASPALIESSITNILEDNLAGIEGLDTITSDSNAGHSEITLVFRPGVSMASALSSTQDVVGTARSLLPREVKAPQVERQRKSVGLPFMGITLSSTTRDFGNLTHYANLNLKNVFRSVPGVSSVEIWGQPYTYRISLDPHKLYSFGVNVDEVVNAIVNGNVSLPVGKFREKIASTLNAELKTQKDYEDLLVKVDKNNLIPLKSVADVSFETDKNRTRVRVNGNTGLIIGINRAEDANPMEVSQHVRAALNQLEQNLPVDLKINVSIDQSDFIHASIKSIQSSIIEAIILVLIIVFLFLRNTRATFIPLITIPVSLLGSLIFLKIFGFSINLMTLLAMVLAIGLVVDDAIIILENIWRHIEDGLNPIQAALKGASETGFAIVAMTFTLASVYLPIAFIQGMLGQLFIEFAVALAGSVIVSGIVALTLSPLMCASLLNRESRNWMPQVDIFLQRLTEKYAQALQWILERRKITLIVALASLMMSIILYASIARETAPKEDRGLLGIFVKSIAGDNIDILEGKAAALDTILQDVPEAENRLNFVGDWGANIVIPLKSHAQRKRSAVEIVEALKPLFRYYPSVDPVIWSWDTGLPGLDDAGTGTALSLVISSPDSYRELFDNAEKLKSAVEKTGIFQSVQHDLSLDTMGYSIDIDNNRLAKSGFRPAQLAKTIEVFFSGDRSQTFEKDGVIYSMNIKGKDNPWTLNELYMTNPSGKRVSLGALATMKPETQPANLNHFQQMHSMIVSAELKKGDSLHKVMPKLMKIAKEELPGNYRLTWNGAAKALKESSNAMIFLLLLSLIFIYAILSAQFENFIDPFVILFTVPLACSGALLFTWIFGQTLNIYTQVGLITLVGLISKHGILIVEFANQLRNQGLSVFEAVKKAAILRLRPVLMTTGAMVFGAIPLILSHDAGSESRHAIGIVLIGGLCLGTFFTLFVLPGIYIIIKGRTSRVQT